MNDTSPEIEALLTARYAEMSGSERALMALQMFETGQQIVLSSLDPTLSDHQRRRELCRRFYGDALARAAFPEPQDHQQRHYNCAITGGVDRAETPRRLRNTPLT